MTNDPNSANHPNPAYDLVMHQADNSGEGHYPFPDVVSLREPLKIHEVEGNLPANRTIDERMDKVPEPVLAQTPAVLHYPKSRDVIQLISGADILERNLGFNCRSIAIQNLGTNGFIWCPELNIYLTAGYTTMNIFNLPSGVDNLSFVWHTAVFNPASPVGVAGEYANIWLYDDWVMPEVSNDSVRVIPGGVFPAPAIKNDVTPNIAVSEIGVMTQGWDPIGGFWRRIGAAAANADAATPNVYTMSGYNRVYNGASWDRARTPNVFKSVGLNNAGNVWTPAAGKKFRLMGFEIFVTQDVSVAAAGVQTIQFSDNGAAMPIAMSVYIPAAAGAVLGQGWSSGPVQLGNGFLSAAANNILQVTAAALLTGLYRINLWGTEE